MRKGDGRDPVTGCRGETIKSISSSVSTPPVYGSYV